MPLTAIDLFGGAGGLTLGLKLAGFTPVAAVEKDPLAAATYRANHPDVIVWERDILEVDPLAVAGQLAIVPGHLDLLAGCPPCQGFSTMRTRRRGTSVPDDRNDLVGMLGVWAEVLRPRAVLLENVPGLAHDVRLREVVERLDGLGYNVIFDVLDAADFEVPQRRARVVMLALLGSVPVFADPVPTRRSVRDTIGHLPSPEVSDDPLHNHGETRTQRVRERIMSIPPESGLRQLGSEHQLACHRRAGGFYDVYGRMAWDRPAPTITGGCINPSKGRFLHPDQDRAITLREAALLQTFPMDYSFPLVRGKYRAAELIGNALPPRFVERHAALLAAALNGASR